LPFNKSNSKNPLKLPTHPVYGYSCYRVRPTELINMFKKLPRILAIALVISLASQTAGAQEADTTSPVSVDPELLALQNARVPKEYTIGNLVVTGANFLDTGIVVSISGMQPGDKLMIPGTDAFSKAITNLWRQRLFSNVQVFITGIRDEVIDIEINVQERPKLGSFRFQGIKKTEAEELEKKAGLIKSTIITENTRRNAVEAIRKYFIEKGFQNVQVRIDEKTDPVLANASNANLCGR
jgi:outer membrane protein insertion porin family